MIRILTNDGIEKSAYDKLANGGFEVVNLHYDSEELKVKIQDIDVLTVRSATKVTKDIIDAALITGKLKLIIRGGVGIDNIDAIYANKNGITVANTPNASSSSVAELVIGHMFSLARYIGISNVTMRNGEWNKKKYLGTEISGKTLGLIGYGRIAQETARMAIALGMKVIYTNQSGVTKSKLDCEYCDIAKLLGKSDFISLHIPFNEGCKPVISTEEVALMKDGVYIINTARGGLISETALLEALVSGKVAGAALDVFEEEPTNNKDLIACPNVSVTPHIGGSTKEAQERIGDEIVNIINKYFEK
jgi:D-3-phosphoglycerate dehydrogenase